MKAGQRLQRGMSLVELAVSLSIAALVTVLVATLLPLGTRVAQGERELRELAEAEQALLGYMRSHNRLPAADADGDGIGDPGTTTGWLPVAEMGLPSRLRIRYQVEPTLTAPPGDLFRPMLPPEVQSGQPLSANGLDVCMRLLLNQRAGLSAVGAGVPVAYYLGHPGAPGHDGIAVETVWQSGARPLPGSLDAASPTVAAGPGELAGRLACPDRLARAQGGAQAAYAAYSALRMGDFHHEFREFDVRIAELVAGQAETTRTLAIYRLADAISSEAVAIVLTAAGWPPNKPGIVAGGKWLAGRMGGATLSLAVAINGLASAEAALGKAQEDLDRRRANLALVQAQRDRTRVLYINASRHAIQLDQAGLAQ